MISGGPRITYWCSIDVRMDNQRSEREGKQECRYSHSLISEQLYARFSRSKAAYR